MEKLKAGTVVKHTEFELEGVILGEFAIPDFYFIEITKGENPVEPSNKHYVAHVDNLDVLEEGNEELDVFEELLEMLSNKDDEAEDMEEVDSEDTFDAEIELPDGTVIRFNNVQDLITFVSEFKGNM